MKSLSHGLAVKVLHSKVDAKSWFVSISSDEDSITVAETDNDVEADKLALKLRTALGVKVAKRPRRPSAVFFNRKARETVGQTVTFSVLKASEGGQSFADAAEDLRAAGVTQVFKGHSPYVGQYGIIVPKKFEKKARRVLHL